MSEIINNFDTVPTHIALVAGAIAGMTVDVALFPIDTLKTRLQAPQGFQRAGGFRGILNGLTPAFLGSWPGSALFFITYESTKTFCAKKHVGNHSIIHLFSAALGETVACAIRVPTEVVKQRMQAGHHKSFPTAVRTIYSTTGFFGFYTGFFSTVLREVPFSFIQFPIWEGLKTYFSTNHKDGIPVTALESATCGSVAGAIAGAITCPLDVIKTRIMLNEDTLNVLRIRQTASLLYAEEGARVFLSGIGPRVLWMTMGGFLYLGAYDKAKITLGKHAG